MSLAPGARLGAYEILSQIGAGGMGEVYKARDTRLNRDVAIKVLPEQFALDADRLARFKREAQVLASLNHQNIAAIHGFEEANGIQALVLELVGGPTLADRIAQGPIPLDEALPIARQIAEALEVAHERGIIHRDLKPANIKLRPDGTVKVLDFGLAKALESGPATAGTQSMLATITSPAMVSGAGVILGTAAYMSPEQARGKPVDKRADIWAFGCVLYEMLTGRRAFDGVEVTDVLARVIEREPDFSALAPETSAALRRLLRRCLEKDRKRRLADIADAHLELDESGRERESDGSPAAAVPARALNVRAVMLAFVLGIAASTALWFMMRPSSQARAPVTRVLIGLAPAHELGGVEGRPTRQRIALSPDGRALVFSAVQGERRQLFLRRLDALDAAPLSGTEGGDLPFFSPDGQWVGYWANGELRKVPLSGGPPVMVCRIPEIFLPQGASWGSDDRIVFSRQYGGLWQVSASGGTPEPLTTLDAARGEVSHRLPHVLPGGNAVLFTVTRNRFARWDETEVAVYSRATGTRRLLLRGGADARYVPTGHIVYVREGVLMAAPFDVTRLEVSGATVGVIADVMQAAYHDGSSNDSGAAQLSIADTGAVAYVAGGTFPEPQRSLVLVDRSGHVEALTAPRRFFVQLRLSSDGRRVAVYTAGRNQDVWVSETSRSTFTRLTTTGRNAVPVWTPDGQRIVYRSAQAGWDNLFWRPADGSGVEEQLTRSPNNQVPGAWSPDGRVLAFYEFNDDPSGVSADIWVLPIPGGQARPLLQTPFGESGIDFSPDGRWFAYASDESGRNEVYVQPYPGPGARQQISADGGQSPVWRRNGQELFYVKPDQNSGEVQVMSVSIATKQELRPGVTKALFLGRYLATYPARAYDVTPDGDRFLMVKEDERPPMPVTHIVLVQNWFEELKRLVPTN